MNITFEQTLTPKTIVTFHTSFTYPKITQIIKSNQDMRITQNGILTLASEPDSTTDKYTPTPKGMGRKELCKVTLETCVLTGFSKG